VIGYDGYDRYDRDQEPAVFDLFLNYGSTQFLRAEAGHVLILGAIQAVRAVQTACAWPSVDTRT
jgi:hypothetical protein